MRSINKHFIFGYRDTGLPAFTEDNLGSRIFVEATARTREDAIQYMKETDYPEDYVRILSDKIINSPFDLLGNLFGVTVLLEDVEEFIKNTNGRFFV